ncbi:MAG: hypothetical protein JO353_02705 [Phycisphaerae bacterium]|nr:hypothetical protein [Phycisphaerae bacterium]
MTDEQAPFLTRLGSWFRKSTSPDDAAISAPPGSAPPKNADQDLPLLNQVQRVPRPSDDVPRGWFGRPNKRDVAIAKLQDGFGNLADLLGTVRDNLQRQGERQDELLRILSHLPSALESLPEANRIHGETLKAIHQQIGQQGAHQEKLADILEKLGESSSENREVLDELGARMDHLRKTDQAITDNLSTVGENMAVASKHAATSAQVLEQMKENMHARDEQLQRMLQRNTHRFLVMMIISVVLAIAALAAVADLLLTHSK